MQPNKKMNKTLVASALILGLGNAFVASADTYTISAGAVSDVAVTQHATLGNSEISFGDKIKLNPTAASTCILIGATNAFETDIGINVDGDDTANGADLADVDATPLNDAVAAAHVPGDIANGSTGCLGDAASGGSSGSYMVLEIDGVAGSTVSVDIPDVAGTGWTYSAGAQSCVVDFSGTAAAEVCETFSGRTSVASVGLALAEVSETAGSFIEVDNEGQTHLLLAGNLTFDGTALTAGPVSSNITVTVTYE